MCTAVFLFYDVKSSEFRQYNLQQARALQVFETNAGVWRHHYFVELHLNALTTDNLDAVCHATEGIKRLLFYLEIQLGSKADATHHAQWVVRERNLRIQRCGDNTILQVGYAIEGVHQFSEALLVQTDGHRIDSKVATILVIFQRTILYNRFT